MVAKVAVIGVGGWGKNHVRVLAEIGALAAVCDSDGARTKAISAKYDAKSYTSVDDMLAQEHLDGCLVCTPINTHHPIAKKVIERGLHTFVEKPLALTSQECEDISQSAQKKHVILTVGYIERFNPAVTETQKLLAEKKYGELVMMEFHRERRTPVHIRDVGIISDTSVHDIDTAMFLFNAKPNVVFARAGRLMHDYEDHATIVLGFDNQRSAVIATNWLTSKRVRTFSAVCTEGIITGDFITQETRIDHDNEILVPRRPYQEPLTLELKNFVSAIEGKENSLISAQDATNVTKVAEAALLSSETGSPIYLDLK